MHGMSEEEVEQFEAEIGMRSDPAREALEALRAHQAAAGITFDNPDAPVPPDAKGAALMQDEEIGGSWMGMGGPHG